MLLHVRKPPLIGQTMRLWPLPVAVAVTIALTESWGPIVASSATDTPDIVGSSQMSAMSYARPVECQAQHFAAALVFPRCTAHPWPAPRPVVARQSVAVDADSLPGCVEIVGQPPEPTCLPCPPLWLGGPTIRCVTPRSFPRQAPVAVAMTAQETCMAALSLNALGRPTRDNLCRDSAGE